LTVFIPFFEYLRGLATKVFLYNFIADLCGVLILIGIKLKDIFDLLGLKPLEDIHEGSVVFYG